MGGSRLQGKESSMSEMSDDEPSEKRRKKPVMHIPKQLPAPHNSNRE